MVSARRTYLDLLLRPIIAAATSNDPSVSTNPAYYFYDLNAKLNWRVGPRDRVYFSAFSGEGRLRGGEHRNVRFRRRD